MSDWIRNLKEKMHEKELDGKQLFLGIIIFIVAIIFLCIAFHEEKVNKQETNMLSKAITRELNKETHTSRVSNIEQPATQPNLKENNQIIKKPEPENVTLNFALTADKDMEYKVYYTTKTSETFSPEKMISYRGKAGTHTYSVHFPVSQISRFSIEFEKAAGKITIKNVFLSGSQQADLNNFDWYQFTQLGDIQLNADHSVSFVSYSREPSLTYYRSLIEDEEDAEKEAPEKEQNTTGKNETTDEPSKQEETDK